MGKFVSFPLKYSKLRHIRNHLLSDKDNRMILTDIRAALDFTRICIFNIDMMFT